MKKIINFLARHYKKVKNIKLVILLIIPILSYYFDFYFELIVLIDFMLFLIELKKWRF